MGTDLELRCILALVRSVVAQIRAVDQSDEFEEHLGLRGTAIAPDQGGVANASDATSPEDYQHLGWKRFGDGPSPQGNCLGWLDGEHFYLDPEPCYQTANSVAWRLGGDLDLQACTLKKRLKQKGLLASFDEGRTTTRKTINGTQKRVLHLNTTAPLVSGYKSSRFSWLERAGVSTLETVRWKACRTGVFSKTVMLRTCRSL